MVVGRQAASSEVVKIYANCEVAELGMRDAYVQKGKDSVYRRSS